MVLIIIVEPDKIQGITITKTASLDTLLLIILHGIELLFKEVHKLVLVFVKNDNTCLLYVAACVLS
jgi:hypothetical protein